MAYVAGELDDWLPHAACLIDQWSTHNSNTFEFRNTWEIIIAAWLLEDDLLPNPAKTAFAKLMLKTISEADDKKIRLDCLHIKPPKPGRKQDHSEIFNRLREVKYLIKEGKTATEAYKVVAEKYCKSPDTIRRAYERKIKRGRMRKQTGKND
jgi:hypothetical protein